MGKKRSEAALMHCETKVERLIIFITTLKIWNRLYDSSIDQPKNLRKYDTGIEPKYEFLVGTRQGS